MKIYRVSCNGWLDSGQPIDLFYDVVALDAPKAIQETINEISKGRQIINLEVRCHTQSALLIK